jgi:hypothetical protein
VYEKTRTPYGQLMTADSVPKVILLHGPAEFDSYSRDWLDAFLTFPLIRCIPINLSDCRNSESLLKKEIQNADCIIALHSTNTNPSNIRDYMHFVPVLQKRKIPFFTFVGNEYNIPFHGCRFSEKIRLFRYLKPEVICTQMPLASGNYLYKELEAYSQVREYPHALNEKVFIPRKKQKERPIDLGIKTGKYGNYIGDKDRNEIVDYFKNQSEALGLKTHIDNGFSSKVGREAWVDFLNDCKGTIGNESGTWFSEPDDHTVIEIMYYVRDKLKTKKPPYWFDLFERFLYNYFPLMPYRLLDEVYKLFNTKLYLMRFCQYNRYAGVADYNYEEIYERFFKNHSKERSSRCISSRHFDAMGTKTCQILFDGKYNGILKPDEHYIRLNSDFSNISEVMRKFKDDEFRNALVDKTYDFATSKHLYKHRVEQFYKEVILQKYSVNLE